MAKDTTKKALLAGEVRGAPIRGPASALPESNLTPEQQLELAVQQLYIAADNADAIGEHKIAGDMRVKAFKLRNGGASPGAVGAGMALSAASAMAPSQVSGMMGMGSVRAGVGKAVTKVGQAIAGDPNKAAKVAEAAEKTAENPGWWAKVTNPKAVAKGIAIGTGIGVAGAAGVAGTQATYHKMRDKLGVQANEDRQIMAQQQGQQTLARITAEDTANQKVIAGKIELGKEKLGNEAKMNEGKMEMLKGQMNAATAIFQNSASQAINYLPRMPSDLYSGLGIAPLPQYAQPTQQPSMAP